MTPAARYQAAVELLDAWRPGAPMDRRLVRWGRGARYAGSKDRAAVADLVYDALRRLRSLSWPAPPSGRAALLGLAAERGELTLFDGARHAPAEPSPEERARLSSASPDEAPDGVRHDLPDWLPPRFADAFGADAAGVMDALRERAPVDLRVNRLKADPETARRALARDGVETAPGPLSPDCLRVRGGGRALRRSQAYLDGLVEIQDAASQAAAAFAQARPGERVLDWCAGGGGKSLALAAATEGRGEIVAHDVDPARMADLPQRAARAGAAIRVLPGAPDPGRLGRFDLVFVDAPCSGSGAWRRNPDAKWGLTPARLEGLQTRQREAALSALRFLAPGGRLVYATCSLLEEENGASAREIAAETGLRLEAELRLTPLEGGDGFYAARLV